MFGRVGYAAAGHDRISAIDVAITTTDTDWRRCAVLPWTPPDLRLVRYVGGGRWK